MNDHLLLLEILILLVSVALNAVFYGFGSAIQNINQKETAEYADQGNERAGALLRLIEDPGRFIGTNHAATALSALVSGALIWHIAREAALPFYAAARGTAEKACVIAALLAALLLAFTLIVSFGIVIPRKCAANWPDAFARNLYTPVRILMFAAEPFHRLISVCSRALLRLFHINPDADEDKVTEDDIRLMVSEGHEQGLLKDSEAEMVNNVFELDEKEAGAIMTHRTNIIALDCETTLGEAVDFILNKSNNSRFPVYRKNIDNIIGVLHIRDVLSFCETPKNRERKLSEIPGLLREPHYIPEIRKIDQLFHDMQRQKIHMVIVVDEYGQTAGLITMEDVLEEIVGNIEDEYDEEQKLITKKADGSFIIDGSAPLSDVGEALGIEFDPKDLEDFETISGFLISRIEHIPEEDEKPVIAADGWIFRVHQVRNRMIHIISAVRGEIGNRQEKAPVKAETAGRG